MRKIINGRMYDTRTAKEIGGDHYSYPGDFHYWSEMLYIKKTGEYFLYGTGGPASKYSRAVGQNEWSGDETIIPMSPSEAREWGEKHLDADEYIAAFGEPSEDDEDIVLTIRLPATQHAQIKAKAVDAGISIAEYIRQKL